MSVNAVAIAARTRWGTLRDLEAGKAPDAAHDASLIRRLAHALGEDAQDAMAAAGLTTGSDLSEEAAQLARDIDGLSESNRAAVRFMIESLKRSERG